MDYAIGDIHGGSKTFSALLSRINLRHADRLFLLGDYVDRGSDSKGVLDTISGLMSAGYDVRPIRGNHDDMMLRCLTNTHDMYSEVWLEIWGRNTLASFGIDRPEMMSERYISLLESMPYLQQNEDFVFVHAGLNMATDDPLTQSNPAGMLWSDVRVVVPEKIGGRKLVSGHSVRSLAAIEESLSSSRVYVDNGAFTGQCPDYGHLVALNLETMQLTTQPWIDGAAEE